MEEYHLCPKFEDAFELLGKRWTGLIIRTLLNNQKRFSDICNASKSNSENYRIQKEWKDTFVPKFKVLLENLNKGGFLTFEMVRSAVTTGKSDITNHTKDNSFFEI